MTTEITLTPKQYDLLQLAATRYFGNTLPAAGHVGLHGGAYEAVGTKLKNLGLLEGEDSSLWRLSEAAYALLGIEHQRHETEPESAPEAEQPLEVALFEALGGEATLAMGNAPAGVVTTEPLNDEQAPAPKKRKLRDGTKQAQVIDLLKRPEGATLTQIMEATGWKIHTARAVLSRTIQKDLGIALASEKVSGGERVYRANV
jgi:hypothetical protein